MNAELANLGTKFSQNVQSEVNASAITVNDVKELDGLSKEQIAAAAEAAKARGLDGKYVITLLNTTGQPPLTNLANRALRQKIYEASTTRGSRGGEDAMDARLLARSGLRHIRGIPGRQARARHVRRWLRAGRPRRVGRVHDAAHPGHDDAARGAS